MAHQAPSVARDAVLKESSPLPDDMPRIKGYDFNQGVDHKALLQSYLTTGFQASSFALAVQEINKMVSVQDKAVIYLNMRDISKVFIHDLLVNFLFNYLSVKH